MRACWIVLFLARLCIAADDTPRIDQADPQVEHKVFDPKKPPDPPPPLEPGEEAVCTYKYTFRADLGYSTAPDGAGQTATITSVKVALGLEIVIWLPEGASDHLKAHEEGHRTIAQAFYKDAPEIARPLAARLLGQKIAAAPDKIEEVAAREIDKRVDKLCEEYLSAINGPAEKAQKAFDDLTDHARKKKPAAEEAVRRAIDKSRPPATRPRQENR